MTTNASSTMLDPPGHVSDATPEAVTPQPRDGVSSNKSAISGTVFLGINIAMVVFVATFGANQTPSSRRTPRPVPKLTPVLITPRFDRPEVISDSQLQRVLHKLRPALRHRTPNLNHIDHALRLWGVTATFTDPDCFSGVELRGLLTDHRHFQEHWGPATQPFILPNTRSMLPYVEFRTRSGPGSSSHVDHTLASLAEVSTPLDYPLNTPSGELPLKAALDLAFDRFQLNQSECEWSALAFLHYLPHEKGWRTREGQHITWDMIADRLMRQKLAQGSCYGNHRLHTLACILRVDETNQILTPQSRVTIVNHLKDATARLIQSQHADGYWTRSWPGEEWDGNSDTDTYLTDTRSERLLATGHALEWWAFAPDDVIPPRPHIVSAASWLTNTIDEMSDSDISNSYTFLTHAVRALSLWRGAFPADIYRPNALSSTHPDDPAHNGDTQMRESQ